MRVGKRGVRRRLKWEELIDVHSKKSNSSDNDNNYNKNNNNNNNRIDNNNKVARFNFDRLIIFNLYFTLPMCRARYSYFKFDITYSVVLLCDFHSTFSNFI